MQCIFKFLQLSKIVKYNSFFFFSDAGSSQVSDTVFGFISLVSRIVPSPAFSFVYVFTEEKLGDLGSIPALGRSPGEGNSYPLRILALRITWAEEPGRLLSIVAKNRTRLSDFHFHSWFKYHVSFRCTIQRLSFTYIYTHTHTHILYNPFQILSIFSIIDCITRYWGLPRWHSRKESACQCRGHKRHRFDPWVRKIPWRRKWQPTSLFLPGKSHVQRTLAGYSSWGRRG